FEDWKAPAIAAVPPGEIPRAPGTGRARFAFVAGDRSLARVELACTTPGDAPDAVHDVATELVRLLAWEGGSPTGPAWRPSARTDRWGDDVVLRLAADVVSAEARHVEAAFVALLDGLATDGAPEATVRTVAGRLA